MTPHQTRAVENAKCLRHDRHVMGSFNVTEIGRTTMISFTYGPQSLPNLYHEIHIVGPRGGVKRQLWIDGRKAA